jgi:glucokinase
MKYAITAVCLSAFGRRFLPSLLAGTHQADQQAAAVLGIGAGLGQAKLAAARSSQLAYKLQAYIIFRRCEHVS